MKRLLHVVNISFVIPYFLGEQLIYFRERGYKEFIICSPSLELDALSKKYLFEYQNVEILRQISIWEDIKAIYKTTKYIRKNHVDVVTGHTPKGALIAMLAAYLMRVPIRLYFRHGLVYETSVGLKRSLLVSIDRFAAMLATKVICVSPSVCVKSIEDKLNRASKQLLLSRGTCNGINIDHFSKHNLAESYLVRLKNDYGLTDSDFVIGFTGRLVRDKGVIELVQAFGKIQEKYSNVVLLLVGMLEERDALSDEIVQLIKHNQRIICTGYVENSNIEYYYALMDIFVLPSYREGFPTSVLEASAMEIPVITTKVTGCVDSIIEGQTGVFVKHDSESISNAIEQFYLDENRRLIYGQNARQFVIDNFDQHLIWREIEKLYEEQ